MTRNEQKQRNKLRRRKLLEQRRAKAEARRKMMADRRAAKMAAQTKSVEAKVALLATNYTADEFSQYVEMAEVAGGWRERYPSTDLGLGLGQFLPGKFVVPQLIPPQPAPSSNLNTILTIAAAAIAAMLARRE